MPKNNAKMILSSVNSRELLLLNVDDIAALHATEKETKVLMRDGTWIHAGITFNEVSGMQDFNDMKKEAIN